VKSKRTGAQRKRAGVPTDFIVEGGMGFYTLMPATATARAWAKEHIYQEFDFGAEVIPVDSGEAITEISAGFLSAGLSGRWNGDALYLGDEGAVCVRRAGVAS
jgi:hypothetical protein